MFAATTTARPASPSNVGAAATSENPPPEHPVTAAQVHEILELTGSNTMKREMLDGMLPHLKADDAVHTGRRRWPICKANPGHRGF
jgi:hypothetical protein